MILLFFLSAFISEVIGTMAGFGSSTVFLPLALFFVDFQSALTLVAFFHISGNLGRIGFFRKGLDNNLVLQFGIPSVVFTLIGAYLVSIISQEFLKTILGFFLILFALLSLIKENFSVPASTVNSIIGGSISGFLAGLIGTGGAIRGAFLTGFKLPKEKYIATAAAIALAVDLTRIPVYLNRGFLKNEYYFYLPILFLIAISGSYTGKIIVSRIPQKKFRKIVLLTVLLIGVKFVWEWFVA